MEDIVKAKRVMWTRKMERFLRRNFGLLSMAEIADGLGIPVGKAINKAKRMGLRVNTSHVWTESETQWLTKNYPNMFNEDIAAHLGISASKVCSKATRMGLRKSDAFHAAKITPRRVKGIQDKAKWRHQRILDLANPPAGERKEG